jgi:acyl-coenzyme A thioesterase PaaI-like protein
MNLFAEIGTHLSGLEQLRAMMESGRRSGIEETLGFRMVELEAGRVVIEGTPGLHVYNPIGTVHGGYTASILDNACGYVVQSKMAPGHFHDT